MKIHSIKIKLINTNLNVIIIFLIIIQSCGIRFFNGQGILLSIIIIALLLYNLNLKKIGQINILFFLSILLISLQLLVNESSSIKMMAFQVILILEILLLFKNTKEFNKLTVDLYTTLTIFFYNAALGIILYILFPFLFSKLNSETNYLTFFYIFYVIPTQTFVRNTGLLWEPGLLQLMLNLYLFFSIKRKVSIIKLGIIILIIVSTFSTTGYLILIINGVYYLKVSFSKNNIIGLFFIGCIILLFKDLLNTNIINKFNLTNTSGLIRLRDFIISIDLIKEKPLLGHGLFDLEYLLAKNNILYIEEQILSNKYLNSYGQMSGGFTNGLFGIFCWYGIPVGIYLYYCLYRNRFVDNSAIERITFFLILVLTFFSEPITYTSFFLLFPFSYVYYKNNYIFLRR